MDVEEIWQQAKEILNLNITDDDPRGVFLNMLTPIGAYGDQFVLVTSSEQVGSWVNKNYIKEIKAAVLAVTETDYTINVSVKKMPESQNRDTNTDNTNNSGSNNNNSNNNELPSNDFSNNSMPQANTENTPAQRPEWMEEYYAPQQPREEHFQQQNTQQPVQQNNSHRSKGNEALFAKCTFESFVKGASNQFAHSAAMAVAEQPGSLYNPLFIYGNSGLGKTHLLVAIANYVGTNFPRMNTCYVSANEFLNDFVEATRGNQWGKFNVKYQQTDVLLIDDVQYLEGKDETINQLFNILNKMTSEYKQVVLSADRAPKDLDMDERIRSRFMQGMLADVKAPDYETRLAIIRNCYHRAQQTTVFTGEIPDEVLENLAENATSNIREMEGAVTRLIGNVSLFHRDTITVEEAREVLQDYFARAENMDVSIADIQSEVERFFGISHEDMISSKRQKPLTYPRHIAIYLSRYMTSESYESIGKKFGGRDHSTILYSVSKIEKEQKDNRQLFDQVEQLMARISERTR